MTPRGPNSILSSALVLFLSLVGCRPLFRAPAVDRKTAVADADIARKIDLDLVSDLGVRTIRFEVHWVDGYRPTDYALAGLREATRRIAPEKTVELDVDPTPIPRAEWDASGTDEVAADVWVERHARSVERSESVRTIQIVYIPDGDRWFGMDFFGMAGHVHVERPDGSFVRIPVIYMAMDPIVRSSILWLAPKRSERSTLVHEYGHLLGLTRDPRHSTRVGGGHCTEPQCVMDGPTRKKILYNLPRGFFTGRLPTWYCTKCMEDLRTARRWATEQKRAGADPIAVYRRWTSLDRAREEVAALIQRGREDEARERVRRIVREEEWSEDLRDLAFAVWRYAWYSEAESLFRRYEDGAPPADTANTRQYRFEVMAAQGRYDEALVEAKPEEYPWVRVELLRGIGRTEEAIALARSMTTDESLPAGALAHSEVLLSEALCDAGRFDEALEAVHRAAKLENDRVRLRSVEGEVLSLAGRSDDSEEAFREVLEEYGRLPEKDRREGRTRYLAARAHAHLGETDAALRLLQGAGGRAPREWDLAYWSRILAFTGDSDRAMEALERARRQGAAFPVNPCLEHDLLGLRDDPRFKAIYPCAARTEEPRP